MIRGTILNAGEAQGATLALSEPLSFWGAFDPRSGRIVDVHHAERGACLTGRVLLMQESRGSGTAPGAIAEAIRLGTAPAAIILVVADINLAIGAAVAERLYGRACPVLAVSPQDYASLVTSPALAITRDGTITPL